MFVFRNGEKMSYSCSLSSLFNRVQEKNNSNSYVMRPLCLYEVENDSVISCVYACRAIDYISSSIFYFIGFIHLNTFGYYSTIYLSIYLYSIFRLIFFDSPILYLRTNKFDLKPLMTHIDSLFLLLNLWTE